MIIIAAMGRNRVIGVGDGMPWDVPEEYQHFLDTVRDQTVIIGRKSFEIFGPTLTCRSCYVVTHGAGPFENGERVGSIEEAIEHAQRDRREVYVAGGASIYALAIDRADRMLLSFIRGDFEGDARFPKIRPEQWDIVRQEDHDRYQLVEYHRRRPPG